MATHRRPTTDVAREVSGAQRPGDGPHRAAEGGVWSATKRWTCLAVVLGLGCAFTTRPMIPLNDDDAGNYNPAAGADAGRGGGGDGGVVAVADASVPSFDVAAFDGPPPAADVAGGSFDSHCHRVDSDGGDAGYVDEDGAPCIPATDGGGGDVPDASDADAARDTAGDGVTSGAL